MCIACMLLLLSTGCRSFDPAAGEGLFAFRDTLNIDNIRGPLERSFAGEQDALEEGRKFTPEERQRLDAARKLYDDGRYEEALAAYKPLTKMYRETSIAEEAWYRMGECHFALKRYPDAQNCFDQLFEDYPSTRYVEPTTRRLFAIARTWLEAADPQSRSEIIRTVSAERTIEEPEQESAPTSGPPPSLRYRIIPNLFDGSRPAFDTQGRALQALKSIWLNDPTGPLADDALMLTASYHLRRDNSVEADRYFRMLREEYPDSPHLEDAFVLGSHVKLMSYQGAFYEGTSLTAAERLKEQSLRLFPDSDSRQQLRSDLQKLYLLQAERAFSRVRLYQRKDNPRAVAIACQRVISEYPETRFAEEARKIISGIDRRRIEDLPGMSGFLDSLPPPTASQPDPDRYRERRPNSPGNTTTVSGPDDTAGRVRL